MNIPCRLINIAAAPGAIVAAHLLWAPGHITLACIGIAFLAADLLLTHAAQVGHEAPMQASDLGSRTSVRPRAGVPGDHPGQTQGDDGPCTVPGTVPGPVRRPA